MKLKLQLYIVLLFASIVSTERVLFLFPIASKSHANVFEPLIKGLAARGHDVNVVTPILSKSLPPRIHEIAPIGLSAFLQELDDPFEMRRVGKFKSLASFNLTKLLQQCHKAYLDPEFQNFTSQAYDLVIMNGFVNNCFDGVIYKLKAPHVLLTTMPAPSSLTESTGNYLPSSFVPIPFLDLSDRMGFRDRLLNWSVNRLLTLLLKFYYSVMYQAVYNEYIPEAPGYFEIHGNVSMIFMNSHFSLTYPRPNLPDNVEIGGMHCRPPKPLPRDMEEFLSGAEHGFIYFSLGSIVQANQMPEAYRKIFVNVFGRMRQRVIWKWETEEMADLPGNVKLSKWVPQQDVLGHPNIRLFITHGGLLSTQEAVYHGVPLLGIPIFADQDLNMNQAVSQGYALGLEVLELTEEIFEEKLLRLLNEPAFDSRAKELSSIFRDQPQTPLERAVFWSEYIMRHKGAPHLRSAARDLNYFQIHSYDVIGFLVLVLLIVFVVIRFTCSKLVACCFKSTSKFDLKINAKKRN